MPSRTLLRPIVYGCIAVAVVDTAGSLISERAGISYGFFAIPSLIVYSVVGIAAAHRGSIASAASAGAAVALFDATFGWWISWQIGPGRMDLSVTLWPTMMVFAAHFSISVDTTCATVAGALWLRRRVPDSFYACR